MEEIEDTIYRIKVEFRSCATLCGNLSTTLAARQALINNKYGNLNAELIKNQEDWQDYLARIAAAQMHIQITTNWMCLLRKEWEERQAALSKFWGKYLPSPLGRMELTAWYRLARGSL